MLPKEGAIARLTEVVGVRVSIHGLHLEPDELTRALGVSHTDSLRPMVTHEVDLDGTDLENEAHGIWYFDTSESVTSRNLEEHLRAVLTALARLPEASGRLPVEGRQLHIAFTGRIHDELPQPDEVHAAIGADLLGQFGRLSLDKEAISWQLDGR